MKSHISVYLHTLDFNSITHIWKLSPGPQVKSSALWQHRKLRKPRFLGSNTALPTGSPVWFWARHSSLQARVLSEIAAISHSAVVKINGVMQILPKLSPSQENWQMRMLRSTKIIIITTKLKQHYWHVLVKVSFILVQFIIFINNFTVFQAPIWIWSSCRITCQRAK